MQISTQISPDKALMTTTCVSSLSVVHTILTAIYGKMEESSTPEVTAIISIIHACVCVEYKTCWLGWFSTESASMKTGKKA